MLTHVHSANIWYGPDFVDVPWVGELGSDTTRLAGEGPLSWLCTTAKSSSERIWTHSKYKGVDGIKVFQILRRFYRFCNLGMVRPPILGSGATHTVVVDSMHVVLPLLRKDNGTCAGKQASAGGTRPTIKAGSPMILNLSDAVLSAVIAGGASVIGAVIGWLFKRGLAKETSSSTSLNVQLQAWASLAQELQDQIEYRDGRIRTLTSNEREMEERLEECERDRRSLRGAVNQTHLHMNQLRAHLGMPPIPESELYTGNTLDSPFARDREDRINLRRSNQRERDRETDRDRRDRDRDRDPLRDRDKDKET